MDADAVKGLLSEVLEVCQADSHIYRAALITMKMGALHSAGSIDANDIGQERAATSMVPLSLNQLAHRAKWCEQRDEPGALDEVIFLHYDALRYYNTGDARRVQLLCNLSLILRTRFERQGNDEDLDQGITLQREVLALHPVGHTDRSMSLHNLALQLFTHFQHRGNDENLDQAIALQREALALRPVGHTDRSQSLNNFANQLYSRLEHRGNNKDLDQAIALHREALALCPVGHTDQSMSLNSLAVQLSSCFQHRGNDEDLDQGITLQREVLALHPVGHTDQSMSLNNLALQLSSRFKHQGNDEDLDQAIALHREALVLCPVGHTDQCWSLDNLAVRLSSCFEHQGNDEDLDQAITLHREALALLPIGHTYRSSSLNNLANQLSSCFEHQRNREDLDESRENLLCALALLSGNVCRAIELLEQGRTIIWTKMGCSNHAVSLMKKFRDLSSLLDRPPASHSEGTSRIVVEAEEALYRRLVVDWNGTVEEIRKIEGFSRFLLPPLFSDLQDAARDGPIIVLIASELSCDAIIIPHKQDPTSIQLLINLRKLAELVTAFREVVTKDAATFAPRYHTPDKVIHLAAGLQFAGVKSVAGTLWNVDDFTVERLVKVFYTNLCGDGTMDSKRAVRALNQAVQSLASDKDIPLAQRISMTTQNLLPRTYIIPNFEIVYIHLVMGWLGFGWFSFGFQWLCGSLAIQAGLSRLEAGSNQLDASAAVPTRVNGRFRLGDILESGSYGVVYHARNIINDDELAVKLEPLINNSSSLEQEYNILKDLEGGVGIPRAIWFGREATYDALVLDLLGPSLHDLFLARK
ncbi:hypothetical protein C8R48DRAFT_668276 [Suillus tomentosus]|nr:hypothetical protein C8R48DRAFT_668276 [Suillus tomentosus]